MNTVVIEPHYLGSLEYFTLLMQSDNVCLEICDSFQKQTYRNRAYFLTSNKTQSLIVPLNYSNGTPTKDVKIDYSQRWLKDHWGAFYSAYGKAPFFEYFSDDFRDIWEKKKSHLIEMNIAFLELVMKLLQIKIPISFTSQYDKVCDGEDYRNLISPKKPFSDRTIYRSITYTQLFGNIFVPNLSVVDLLMCEGPNARQILLDSIKGRG